ncbi:hypothetical protein COO91_09652 (plasmid) [Nostoc flagelliforme CCNUN1]|uniref:Uncharacterized protein n=1 Tax=Nostoc flagelliforme CCNUN1 TaxID=2038116 RepID=A0A2K8T721_9NOSO|nr:hypothetical protein [Nostoc flagelliforme]AUB43471.1 hypothetical protein COO91_09652 [Nostoc flagelliforme CCNUN1]
MSQIEIAQIIEQIKQEITVDSNGQGKASIRATARLADVQDSSLRRALLSAALEPSALAQSLIQQGFSPAALETWNEGIPDMGVAAVIEYYAFDAGRYCKQQARLVCKAFNRIGVRAWMQDIMGWTKPATQAQEQPTTPALPPVEQRLHTLVLAMKTLAELTGGRLNPYMEQQFKDYAGNLLAEHNRKLLTPSEERWLGVVNFAESELGKKVPLSGAHYRGHLGTWVRTFYPHLGDRQETRLVNGVQQPIYVYACHNPVVAAGLTKAIEEFFAHPSPGAALRQAGAFASKKAVVTA